MASETVVGATIPDDSAEAAPVLPLAAVQPEPAPAVVQAHPVGQAAAAGSTGSLVGVVCEGWAVAAAPLAKENLRALLLPPTAEQRAADRRNTAVTVGVVVVSILAGSTGYVPVDNNSRRAQLATARVAAAGKVVFKLRATFASGYSHVVYRRWSEVEALVKSQRFAASYGEVRQVLATLPLKYKAAARFDTATGALACDVARLAKRTDQINTMLAGLCACTELAGHIDGGGVQTSAARPLAEFIATDRGLKLPTGMTYATRAETVSQRLVPSTLERTCDVRSLLPAPQQQGQDKCDSGAAAHKSDEYLRLEATVASARLNSGAAARTTAVPAATAGTVALVAVACS